MAKSPLLIATACCIAFGGEAQTHCTLQHCFYAALQKGLQWQSDNCNPGCAFKYTPSLAFIEPPESAIPNCLNIGGLIVPLQNSTLLQLAYNVETNWRMYPGGYLQGHRIVFFYKRWGGMNPL